MTWANVAVAGGTALGTYLGSKGKGGGGGDSGSGGSQFNVIPRYKSPYAKGAAGTLDEELSARARGERVGYGEDDLRTMRGEAIDETGRMTNELLKRGLSARRLVGAQGVTSGGRARLHDTALAAGLETRTKALRDVGIKNAVMKRQEQTDALGKYQSFLNAERANELGTGAQNLTGQNLNYGAYLDDRVGQTAGNLGLLNTAGGLGEMIMRYYNR